MKDRKLILVSNDDGINANGLKNLIEIASDFGDVFVVAPEKGQSGMSHSISLLTPIRVKKIIDKESLKIFSVPGTPVDCVKLALKQLVERKPDIMLSGINHGTNSAISVIYSGTMGAAIEAGLYGIPSIGFSVLDHSPNADFSLVKKYAPQLINEVIEHGLPQQVCLNVNFPIVDEHNFNGYKICKQTTGVWKEDFEKRIDPYGFEYYWLTGNFHNSEPENTNSDEWALANNYASVVPIKIDFTDYKTIEFLKKFKLNKNGIKTK